MSIDPIANLLITLKNGYKQQKTYITTPASKLKSKICQILKQQGYIVSFKQKGKNLEITLKYEDKIPALNFVRRISKPSRRFYTKSKNMPRPTQGSGIIIISTPQGIMTHFQARRKNLGGEIICEVA